LLQEGADAALLFLQQQAAHMRSLGQERAFARMLAEQVKVLLIKGERSRAAEVSASLHELAQAHRNERGYRAEFPALSALARARILMTANAEEAFDALQEVRSHAREFNRGRLLTLVDVLQAAALDNMNRAGEAIPFIQDAVRAGHKFGLVRTFVDEGALAGRPLARLVRGGLLEGAVMQYAQELLARFPESDEDAGARALTPESAAGTAQRAGARGKQAVLTPREVEILALVAQAMSNKRIALTLSITLETVKWNLRNIFAKLGVSSRYDAMVWARKQNLIH
jgi:LuxR family maltose regulon positive regulatory protein